MPPWSLTDLLPGLYWAVCLALGLGCLKRWFETPPKAIAGAFLALVLALFGQSLFGGEILLPVDNLRGFEPFRQLTPADPPGNHLQGDQISHLTPLAASARRALGEGRWPLWDPLAGAGLPLLAIPESQLLNPYRLVTLPLPLERAAAVAAALQVSTALFFSFLLLRRLGAGDGAAAFGAIAYGLGGFVQLWVGWPRGAIGALLPVALYAVTRLADDDGRRRSVLLLGLAVIAILGAGDPPLATYALLTAGGLLLARLTTVPAGERSARARRVIIASLLAAAIASPLLLPQKAWDRASLETTQVRERARAERLQDPLGLVSLTSPGSALQAAGERLRPVIAAAAYSEHRQTLYPGPVNRNEDAAAFVGTSSLFLALLFLIAGGTERNRLAFWILAAAVALLAVIGLPPLPQLLEGLRLFGPSATDHRRLAVILALATTVLAVFALDRLERPRGRASVVALLLTAAIAWATPQSSHIIVPLAFLLGTWATISWCPRSRRSLVLAALVALELFLLHRGANPPMPRSLYYPTPPAVEFLQQRLRNADDRMAAPHRVLLPRMASIYGLADVRPGRLRPATYGRLVQFLGQPEIDLADPRLDLLGVRWVLTEPQADLAGEAAFADPSGKVWERPHPLPRLFLPAATEVIAEQPWPARLAQLDPRQGALVRATAERPTPWRAATGSVEVSSRHHGPERLSARLSLAEERLLASSIFQDGGWQLLLNGQRHPTELANGPLLASWLPAGDRKLELLYRPRPFLLGMTLSALALALGAAWLASPRRPRHESI